MWRINISASLYNQFQICSVTGRINKNTIPFPGYDRLSKTFLPRDVGGKLAINYDINLYTEGHVPYEPCRMGIIDSKIICQEVLPADHIIYPFFKPRPFWYLTRKNMENKYQ